MYLPTGVLTPLIITALFKVLSFLQPKLNVPSLLYDIALHVKSLKMKSLNGHHSNHRAISMNPNKGQMKMRFLNSNQETIVV